MPRTQTRCPDAQTNKMPRGVARCPGKQDAQINKMPRWPDKQDAQTSNKMPRCHTR